MSAPPGNLPARGAAACAAAAALLAFLIEPLAARRCLPNFGGGALVWTSALFTFQALLVVAWLLGRHLSHTATRRLWRLGGPLAALALVAAPAPSLFADFEPPSLGVIATIALHAGPAFVLLTTCTTVWTRSLSAGGGTGGAALFAAANAGAAAALLLGPVLVDPWLGTSATSMALAVAVLALTATVDRALGAAPPYPPVTLRLTRPHSAWVALPALGTALLATSTQALTQDLSVTPLLWTVPLFVYMTTWVLPFAWPRWSSRRMTAPLLLAACVGQWALGRADWRLDYLAQLAGHIAVLFFAALACHAELSRHRPVDAQLPELYFWTNLGGALGTAVVGFAVPALLDIPVEYPLTLLLTWGVFSLYVTRSWLAASPLRRASSLAVPLGAAACVVALGVVDQVERRARGEARWVRTAHGAMQVRHFGAADEEDAIVHLLDGRISHGWQWAAPEKRALPTAYFSRESGIGVVLGAASSPRRVAIAGLGAGTLAAWARAGDTFAFVELNPASIEIAERDFTFLADARQRGATLEVVEQDARRWLNQQANGAWDWVVLDAFAGDAIPAHLLTREAIARYLALLTPQGCVAINVSNRHADLRRVVAGHAEALGLWAGARRASSPSPIGPYRSDWGLLCGAAPAAPEVRDAFEPLDTHAGVAWTDEHAPLWPLL